MPSPHSPKIIGLRDGRWMVVCLACRNDRASEVPIGIGMSLPDRLTAERLAENHCRGQGPHVAGAQVAASSEYLGLPSSPSVAEAGIKATRADRVRRQQHPRATERTVRNVVRGQSVKQTG